MRLVDRSVGDLLAAFGASDPTPGGGSAAALASAVGASLLMMVAALPKTRAGSDEDRAALAGAAGELTELRERLTEAVDADTAAYEEVIAAYRLPKATDAEKRSRREAIQRALRSATDVPLGVMRLSARALERAEQVAAHGQAAASSDVAVAAALLGAGLIGARANVETNVGSIDDEPFARTVRAEVERLSAQAGGSGDAIDRLLRRP